MALLGGDVDDVSAFAGIPAPPIPDVPRPASKRGAKQRGIEASGQVVLGGGVGSDGG